MTKHKMCASVHAPMNGEDAANYLNAKLNTKKSRGSLAKDRHYGKGPKFILVEGVPRYPVQFLDDYIEEQLSSPVFTSTADYAGKARAA